MSEAVVFRIGETTTNIALIDELPETDFNLSYNYPNPFNMQTTIEYVIPIKSHVEITIYNMLGQVVAQLVNDEKDSGRYRVVWDGLDHFGRPVVSGLYIFQIVSGDFVSSRKLLLLK